MSKKVINILLPIFLFLCFKHNIWSIDKNYLPNILKKIETEKDESKKALLYEEICWRFRGDSMALAREFGIMALKIFENKKDTVGICRIYNKLGVVEKNDKNYFESLNLYNKVISFSKCKNIELELGHAYNNLANLLFFIEDKKLIYKYLNIANIHFVKSKNKDGLAYNYTLLANYYDSIFDIPKALEFHRKALEFRLETNDLKKI